MTPALRFRWTGLGLSNRAYAIDSNGVHSIPDTSDDFSAKAYLLRAQLSYELLAMAEKHQRSGWGNLAYACKCDDPAFQQEHPITSTRVFTIEPFDATHPAGSDVTAYFREVCFSSGGLPALCDFNPQYNNPYAQPDQRIDLYLGRRPAGGTPQQFRVVVTLSSGTAFEQTSAAIRF